MTVRGKIVSESLWPSFSLKPFFFFCRCFLFFVFFLPCPCLVYQAPVFKLNITPVLLRKLWWLITVSGTLRLSGVAPRAKKDPVRSSVQLQRVLFCGLKNCRLPHMFPNKRGMQRGTGGGFYNEVAVVASNAMDTEGPASRVGPGSWSGAER